ncbi:MAG: tocopherol cyclase family protein, partial [Nannocystaceae bacterium]
FVFVVDGRAGTCRIVRYAMSDLAADDRRYDVRIGPNHFSEDGLVLNLDTPELTLHGEVRYDALVPWPVSRRSPGAMGWYAYVPLMQCFHGVVSLDHGLTGTLALDGEALGFDAGRGYIEKDWGRGFPRVWVWCQCNHFAASPGTSLMVSVATIPWLGRTFAGLLASLWHEGRLYRFTTYNRGKIRRLAVDDDTVRVMMTIPGFSLEVVVQRGTRVALLHAPDAVDMVPRVGEALDATVWARLTDRGGAAAWEGEGGPAALEVQGDTAVLQRMLGLD